MERISSLVLSIENELHQSGINVNLKSLTDHVIKLQEDPEKSPNFSLDGEFIEVGSNSPRHFHKGNSQSGITKGATNKPTETKKASNTISYQANTADSTTQKLGFSSHCPSPFEVHEIGTLP